MPKNSSEETVEQRSESRTPVRWPGIGINAVSAASICKSYGKVRREKDASRSNLRFDEHEFATD